MGFSTARQMKTALYSRHLYLGAQCAVYAGWEMPIQYQSILSEHQIVREKVGLFDVSHMGLIEIGGKDAGVFLQFLSTNHIKMENGTATYTIWCNQEGGCVDDVIIFTSHPHQFFVIVNAGNRQKDLEHLRAQANLKGFEVIIRERFEETGILSLQGPRSLALLSSLIPEISQLKPMRFLYTSTYDLYISRTGYTGEKGFELWGPLSQILIWWDLLMEKGKDYEIAPIGLGARDTLRLEMGFALYGHELSESIAPHESVAAWTVKWEKENFLGKKKLENMIQDKHRRWAYGAKLLEKGVPRKDYLVFQDGKQIGEVTSGSFSPTLKQGIALLLVDVPLKEGDRIEIQIRNQLYPAQLVPLPFLKKGH